MANIRICDLPSIPPTSDSFLLASIPTAPDIITTAKVTVADAVAAAGLNSAGWQNTTNVVAGLSSTWTTGYTTLTSSKEVWDNAYSVLASGSANWDGAYATLASFKSQWDAAASTSSSIASLVGACSSNWDSTYSTVVSNSGYWSQTNLGKYTQIVGDGINSEYVVTHNLNTEDVVVQVRSTERSMGYSVVTPSLSVIDATTVMVGFDTPQPVDRYKVVIIG
jgi:hypothetical protein